MEDLRNYIQTLRHDFKKGVLDEKEAQANPVLQFEQWFKQAVDATLPDPNAFVLSTAAKNGIPSSRILLLRNFNDAGFVFYTNYNSRKGKEIAENPHASMLFFWHELERQVRIDGRLEKQSAEESDGYFNSRPRESQIGAWTSEQSQPVESRKILDDKYEKTALQFTGQPVPRPPFWGGYVLKPSVFEFWQGRPGRLHDRILYHHHAGEWHIKRLCP